MGNESLNLVSMARELLSIHEEFPMHLRDWDKHTVADFEMETFCQLWGSTSGGFEGIGGCAMTTQRTYVFIPLVEDEDCQVYFGGRFAYSVPPIDLFIQDVKNKQVKGVHHKDEYFS